MIWRKIASFISLGALILCRYLWAAEVFYVSPNGDDNWDGLSAVYLGGGHGPIFSIEQATQKIREGKRNGKNFLILLDEGDYFFDKPLVLNEDDGGGSDGSVTYKAFENKKVRFIGAIKVRAEKYSENSVIKVPNFLPSSNIQLLQLFLDNARLVVARDPNVNEDYFVRSSIVGMEKMAFRADSSVLKNVSISGDLSRLRVVVRHSWETSYSQVDRIVADTVYLKSQVFWPFLNFGSNQSFYFENYYEALDFPGEWFYDQNENVLHFYPGLYAGDFFYIPITDKLLMVEGRDADAENITFDGIEFAYTSAPQVAASISSPQAAADLGAAVILNRAKNIVFKNCGFKHISEYAIWFRVGVKNSAVINSEFDDLGGGAVRVGDISDPGLNQGYTYGNLISSNSIRNTGVLFEGAVAVFVAKSALNKITLNTIENTTYTGISVGWLWGYGKGYSNKNEVSFNTLINIGAGKLSDLGAIYFLGGTDGGVVEGNFINHVRSFNNYGRGGWGLYADEGASDILFQDNFVSDASTGSFHQHYGRDNRVLNNIFLGEGPQIERSKKESHVSFVLENNIVVFNSPNYHKGFWGDQGVLEKDNIFCSLHGAVYSCDSNYAQFSLGLLDIKNFIKNFFGVKDVDFQKEQVCLIFKKCNNNLTFPEIDYD